MLLLKQNAAATLHVGPLVDATDGYTAETAVALAAGEADLYKHGAAAQADVSGRTWAHVAGGVYTLALLAGDTDTLGTLVLVIRDAAHRPFRLEAMVVPANTYDSLVGGTEKLAADVQEIGGNAASGFLTGATMLKADVTQIGSSAVANFVSGSALNADVTKIGGSAAAADNLEASALAIVIGTVQSGSSTTSIVTDLTETTNDHYNGRVIVFTSGTVAGQAAAIADYAGSTKTITVSALTEAPTNGTTFVIV